MLEESIKPPAALGTSLGPRMISNNAKIFEMFYGSCLKWDKVSSSQRSVINL